MTQHEKASEQPTFEDFNDEQWWYQELDAVAKTDDQRRALAVVRNLMRQFGEARAALAQRPALVALTREQKLTLAGNYFSEPWVIQHAIDLMHDCEQMVGITAPKALVALTDELRQDIASVRKAERWMQSTPLPVPTDVYEALAFAIDNIERAHGITAPTAKDKQP